MSKRKLTKVFKENYRISFQGINTPKYQRP